MYEWKQPGTQGTKKINELHIEQWLQEVLEWLKVWNRRIEVGLVAANFSTIFFTGLVRNKRTMLLIIYALRKLLKFNKILFF